jgi:hypothetical protein
LEYPRGATASRARPRHWPRSLEGLHQASRRGPRKWVSLLFGVIPFISAAGRPRPANSHLSPNQPVQPFCFQGKTPFPFVLQGRNPQIIPEPPIQKEIPGEQTIAAAGAPPPSCRHNPWPHPARDKPSPAGMQAQLPGPGSRRPSSHPPSQVARLPSARLES